MAGLSVVLLVVSLIAVQVWAVILVAGLFGKDLGVWEAVAVFIVLWMLTSGLSRS